MVILALTLYIGSLNSVTLRRETYPFHSLISLKYYCLNHFVSLKRKERE